MSSEIAFLESANRPAIKKSLENKNLLLINEKIHFPYVIFPYYCIRNGSQIKN
tara:strand:+ start:91 stop:249 length:159 start_codon:yes stop_codon:yes gene_type:complete